MVNEAQEEALSRYADKVNRFINGKYYPKSRFVELIRRINEVHPRCATADLGCTIITCLNDQDWDSKPVSCILMMLNLCYRKVCDPIQMRRRLMQRIKQGHFTEVELGNERELAVQY